MALFKSQTSYKQSDLYFHWAFLMAGELFLGLHQLNSMCQYKLVQKERNLKTSHEAMVVKTEAEKERLWQQRLFCIRNTIRVGRGLQKVCNKYVMSSFSERQNKKS